MSRPGYERAEDRANELHVATRFGSAWNAEPFKLPVRYELDYAFVRSGNVVAWAEVKCRSHPLGRYPDFILALSKWCAARKLAEETGKPALVIVAFDGEIHWTRVSGPAFVRIGGRTDRGDPQDLEPVVGIPREAFRCLEVAGAAA